MIHRYYLVTGRVQGVGFRAFTAKRGEAIGLRGRVRNLSDGRVEIVASGTAEKIREFEAAIAKGPTFARVDDLVTEEIDASNETFAALMATASGFERDPDGETPWKT